MFVFWITLKNSLKDFLGYYLMKKVRFLLESNINIMNRLSLQNKKNLEYDEKFELLFSMFENKEKKELIFFDGQVYDAYSKIIDLLLNKVKELKK